MMVDAKYTIARQNKSKMKESQRTNSATDDQDLQARGSANDLNEQAVSRLHLNTEEEAD